MKIIAVAAIGKNRVLGKENKLLWHIPDDLKRFKELTTGHPIILGRKTFESIIGYRGKPLPNRTNIVITRDASWSYDGVIVARTIEEALEKAKSAPGSDVVSIGGGAQIYELALPYTDILRLTIIDAQAEGDAFFPPYEDVFTQVLSDEERTSDGVSYRWLDLARASR